MFCEACGLPVHGKYCSDCGAKNLRWSPLGEISLATVENETLTLADVVDGWRDEPCYERLLKYPEVRQAIDQAAAQAPWRLSGEQFLSIADKLVPQVVSMEGVATAAQLLFTRLGVKTDKRREASLALPVGETLVRVLCSLARRGQPIRQVSQADDGCVIEATQPSDVWSLAGSLVITIHRQQSRLTQVSAVATIPGQIFDWGKNHRSLEMLMCDLQAPCEVRQQAA